MALAALRRRMPFLVFLLLLLVCLLLLGFACACLDEQPALALERALLAPALAAPLESWPLLGLASLAGALVLTAGAPARRRASPALLQRFLF